MKIHSKTNPYYFLALFALLFIPANAFCDSLNEVYVPIFSYGEFGTQDGNFGSQSNTAIDSNGNLYVADTGNDRMQKLDQNGNFVLKTAILHATGIAIGLDGNIIVSSNDMHKIYVVNPQGEILFNFGDLGSQDGNFNQPSSLDTDANGNIYVADTANFRVQKFSSEGEHLLSFGSYGLTNGYFSYIFGVAVDSNNYIYVSDKGGLTDASRIQKFDEEGNHLLTFGDLNGSPNGSYNGIDVDSNNFVYSSDTAHHKIIKYNSNGEHILDFGWGVLDGQSKMEVCTTTCQSGISGSGVGQLNSPFGVTVDSNGFVYVAAPNNGNVVKYEQIIVGIQQEDTNVVEDTNITYSFYLSKRPTSDVNIYFTITAPQTGSSISGDTNTLTITPDNWETPQNIIFTALNDAVYTGDRNASLSFSIKMGDINQMKLPDTDVNIIISDNDTNTPSVTTNSPSNTTLSTITLNGTITDAGNLNITQRGFEYGLDTNYGTTILENGSFGAGVYSLGIFRLAPNTVYHYRAFATNTDGNSYGSDKKFITYSQSEFGSEGIEDGNFSYPQAIALDSDKNIYILESTNNRVQKFDSNFNFITKWGNHGAEDGNFESPMGIAIDSDNYIYVVDTWNYRIQKFNSNGDFIKKWGENGMEDGNFYYPQGIGVGSDNNIYVSDFMTKDVQKFSSDGNFIATGFDPARFESPPTGIAVDSDNNIYVADAGGGGGEIEQHRIVKFDSNGNFILQWGSAGTGEGQFTSPWGIAIDSSNNIFVADSGNNRVQKFDSDNNFLLEFGSLGTQAGFFNNPQGIAVDSNGNIYVADSGNDRIQKFGFQAYGTPPTLEITSPIGGSTTSNSTVTVEYNASITNTSIINYWVSDDNSNWIDNNLNSTYDFTGQNSGAHTYYVVAADDGGNYSNTASVTITASISPPITNIDGNSASWTNSNQTITLTCSSSGSVCNDVNYMIDNNGTWIDTDGNTTTFTLTTDSNHLINYYSTDAVGNDENINTAYAAIDKTAPATVISGNNSSYTTTDQNITLTCSDATSGCNDINYSVDSGAWIDTNASSVNFILTTDGNHSIRYYSRDIAGNSGDMNTSYAAIRKTTATTNTTSSTSSSGTSSASSSQGAYESFSGAEEIYNIPGTDSNSNLSAGRDANRNQSSGGAYTFTINIENSYGRGNFIIRESIPKQIALDVNQLDFSIPPARIINPDPLVEWDFNALPVGTNTITYSVKKLADLNVDGNKFAEFFSQLPPPKIIFLQEEAIKPNPCSTINCNDNNSCTIDVCEGGLCSHFDINSQECINQLLENQNTKTADNMPLFIIAIIIVISVLIIAFYKGKKVSFSWTN